MLMSRVREAVPGFSVQYGAPWPEPAGRSEGSNRSRI